MCDKAGESSLSKEPEVPVENEGEEDDDQAVTMLDVLEEENDLEDDANAVLGGSDDQNCTYSMGCVPRQALYACMTCVPVDVDNFKPAGVCLACSYKCHEGHNLIELYTKRNFQCDCGNSKFGDKKCSIQPEKAAENECNSYNQNFRGVYCTCERPYPDHEDKVDDEMVQCIVCEDWYHGRHLDMAPSIKIASHNFSEMICGPCMEKNCFLWHYADEFAVSGENTENVDVSLDASVTNEEAKSDALVVPEKPKHEEDKTVEEQLVDSADKQGDCLPRSNNGAEAEEKKSESDKEASGGEDKTAQAEGQQSAVKKPSECYLKGKEKQSPKKIASLWPNGWRKNLCTCDTCKVLYETHQLSFLPDESDMVQAYEEAGKERGAASGSQYEQGLRALSSLERTKQLDAIEEYNKMQVELKEFLAGFAASKRVVKEEDIKGFFAELKARKKRKTETGSVTTYFCH